MGVRTCPWKGRGSRVFFTAEKRNALRLRGEIPDWQLVHISNGRESLHDMRHSDLIETIPPAFRRAPWIEVEARLKEVAIEKSAPHGFTRPPSRPRLCHESVQVCVCRRAITP